MKNLNLIAGLDLGSTKFCLSVGQTREDGKIEIIKSIVSKSQGVKNGVVIDLKGAAQAIEEIAAKIKAEKDITVTSVFVNINGDHLTGINARNSLTLSQEAREIMKKDIANLIHSAKLLNTPVDHEIIHSIETNFWVDAKGGIKNPNGMYATKLTADLYLITALSTQVKNLTKTVNRAGLDVKGVTISAMASSKAVLTENEKDKGVILLEIGADTTQILFLHEHKIKGFDILLLGGSNITEAIANEFSIGLDEASRIKLEFNMPEPPLINDEEKIILEREGACESVSRKRLADLITAKTKEVINHLNDKLKAGKYKEQAASGIVITGGAASMDGFLEIAQGIFGIPVRLGVVRGVRSSQRITQPFYAASVGLVKLGQELQNTNIAAQAVKETSLLGFVKRKAYELYEEYF